MRRVNLLTPPPEAKGVWIDPKRCVHFSVCKVVQSTDCTAIQQLIPRSVPAIIPERCSVCGDCVKICPNKAIRYVI